MNVTRFEWTWIAGCFVVSLLITWAFWGWKAALVTIAIWVAAPIVLLVLGFAKWMRDGSH